MKKLLSTLLLSASLSFSGCGTIIGMYTSGPKPYRGFETDMWLINKEAKEWIFALDLPFSILCDTLLLPVTVFWWGTYP